MAAVVGGDRCFPDEKQSKCRLATIVSLHREPEPYLTPRGRGNPRFDAYLLSVDFANLLGTLGVLE